MSLLELVQLIWGRIAVPFGRRAAAGPGLHAVNQSSAKGLRMVLGRAPADVQRCRCGVVVCSPFPATRGFMMLVALLMLVALWLLLTRTRIGLVIQAALTHPEMVESLGHNVPRVFMLVFGGGCGAGRAGRRDRRQHLRHRAGHGGTVGSIIFVVVVVGGMGSLAGRLRRLAADRRDADLRRRRSTTRWPTLAARAARLGSSPERPATPL
jgi:branched-chain amino acid transport system permease protein